MTRKLSPEEIQAERKRLNIDEQVQQASASVSQLMCDHSGATARVANRHDEQYFTDANRQYR